MDDDLFLDEERMAGGFRGLLRKPLRLGAWSLGFCLHLVGAVGYAMWAFFCRWLTSRPFAPLAWGAPIVIVVVAIGFVAATGARLSTSDLVVKYREAAAKAATRGDTKAVELWMEKAVALNPNDKMFRFNLALTAAQDGRRDRARQIMHRLAPNDRQGYPDAHFWIANDMVAANPPLTPKLSKTLQFHLTHALDSERAAPEAHAMLGQLFLAQKDVDSAITHFAEAAKTTPQLRITLGQLYAVQRKPSRAKTEFEKALEHFRGLADEDPDNVEARLYYARCQTLLGRLPEAERILKAGLENSDDARFPQELASLYLLQFDQLWQKDKTRIDQALILLETATEHAPNDPRVLNRLSLVASPPGPARAEVVRLLNRTIAEGKATALVHLALGAIAANEGDFETAKVHCELGLEQQPKTMELLNNLAWAIAHADPPDLDRALNLANAAHQAAPDHPEVLETRGQILAKLGRWQEAITDLEKALPAMPRRARVHDALDLAYENLGVKELADEHRRRAAELNSSADDGR